MDKPIILHYQDGISNKIWAYDPNTGKRYWGRFGNRLTAKDVDASEVNKLVADKKVKGYVEIPGYEIKDNYLTKAEIANSDTTEWTATFDNNAELRDAFDQIELTLTSFGQAIELDSLVRLKDDLDKSRLNISFAPTTEYKLVILALMIRAPSFVEVFDNNFSVLTIPKLKSSLQTNQALFEALGIIKVVRLVTDDVNDDEDACL